MSSKKDQNEIEHMQKLEDILNEKDSSDSDDGAKYGFKKDAFKT